MPSNVSAVDMKDFIKQRKKLPRIAKGTEYVTPREFAQIIKAHYVTVMKWLGAGKIEGAVKFEGRWKIPLRKSE